VIELNSVTFSYPGAPSPSLRDITFSVPEGTLLCLCGVNGSGKSTLLSLLAGLHSPTGGTLSVAGVTSPGREDKLRGLSALVLQDADLQIIGSTVAEDMMLAFPHGLAGAEETAMDMATRFGLADHWHSPVQTLSYGQKRKLCLAVALLGSPGLLLLDEPFSGLDYPAIREMRAILMRNKESKLTQIISVHDLESVIDLADSMVVLHAGGQVRHGKPETVLDGIAAYGVRPPCSWQRGRGIVPWE
jgi:biotin transport system ATP-binding protein